VIRKPYLLALALWLPFAVAALYVLAQERFFLANPGVYAEVSYRGLFFSTFLFARPFYVRAIVVFVLFGILLLYPATFHFLKTSARYTPGRDYAGNVIGPRELRYIRIRFQTLERQRVWKLPPLPRNKVWVGVDVLSGEDVFLTGEQLFTGMLIIGKQGSGKTSRWFKVILKQLARDGARKTAFVVFSLKQKDAGEFSSLLTDFGITVQPWSMCNLLDLAVDQNGGMAPATIEAILQSAAQASGLKSERDPFWLDTAIAKLVDTLTDMNRSGRYPSLGVAYQLWEREIEALAARGADPKMEKGQFQTLAPALGPLRDPSARATLLHSPMEDGGFHYGPLCVARNKSFRRFTQAGIETLQTGNEPGFFPHGAYELPPGARIPFDFGHLLRPTSLILPPPGGSKAERFALNFIKAALFRWIAADMASPHESRLLCRDPDERHRTVLALDEAHNFLSPGSAAFGDTKALQEFREAGLVSLAATQSLSALKQGTATTAWETYLSVIGSFFFLPVSGKERQVVIDFIGKVNRKSLRQSFSRSQRQGPSSGLLGSGHQDGYSESLQTDEAPFITPEIYGRLPDGTALFVTQGEPHRVVYCPYHTKVTL